MEQDNHSFLRLSAISKKYFCNLCSNYPASARLAGKAGVFFGMGF
jgi:hypothetical protein